MTKIRSILAVNDFSPTAVEVSVRFGVGPPAKVIDLFPGARHHLVCAIDTSTDNDAGDADVELEQARLLHESLHAQAEQELQQVAQRLSACARYPLVTVVADDVPARAILVGAASLRADCVVVGHHGQGAATDSFLGNNSQHKVYAAMNDELVAP